MIYLVWACFQVEGESEDQASTDQTSAAKTKSIFIAQNVASLQELGEHHPFSIGGKKCKSQSLSSAPPYTSEWEEIIL